MARVVNIYLGGTGKSIASILKARSAMYESTLAPLVVFDTDPLDEQSGKFRLGRDLRTPGVNFGDRLQEALADWDRLTPAEIRQSVSDGQDFSTAMPVYKAGRKLLPENRSEGAGMWTLRGHGPLALGRFLNDPGGESEKLFLKAAEDMVAREAQGGRDVRVNVVASIAGGTGSGVFLPVLLKLRERLARRGQGVHPEICLYLVLPSAFYQDWGTSETDTTVITRTRGLTGAYAAIRELAFLLQPPDAGVSLAPRTMPLLADWSQQLQYEPSAPVAKRVYWAGMRQRDVQQRARGLFDEVSRVLAVISDPEIDNALSGGAIMGTAATRLSWGAACIEYPLLELAQKQSARAVAAALDQLAGDETAATPRNLYYTDYVPAVKEGQPLTRFVDKERALALAPDRNPSQELAQAENVGDLLYEGCMEAARLAAKPVEYPHSIGTAYPAGYTADGSKWDDIAGRYGLDLDALLDSNVARLQDAIIGWLRKEQRALNEWIGRSVVTKTLESGGSAQTALNAIGDATKTGSIEGELSRLRQFFSRSFNGIAAPSSGQGFLQGVEACQVEYTKRKDQLKTPPPLRRGNPVVNVLVALLAAVVVGWLVWRGATGLDIAPTASEVIGGVVGLAACVVVYRILARQPSLADRRKDAEQKLKAAYDDLLLAKGGELLWGEGGLVCRQFLTPILGSLNGKGGGSLPRTKQLLTDLQAVAERARDRSISQAQQFLDQPNDVAVWIGADDLDTEAADRVLQEHIRHVRQQLNVAAVRGSDAGALSGMNLSIAEGAAGTRSFSLESLKQAAVENASAQQRADWNEFLEVLQEQAWQEVKNDLGLAPTLHARLLSQTDQDEDQAAGNLASYFNQLADLYQQRGGHVESRRTVQDPHKLLLVVKDAAMQALVARALQHGNMRPDARDRLLGGLTAGQATVPYVSNTVGESVVLMGLYELPSIDALADTEHAKAAYYSIGREPELKQRPVHYCAGNSEFHLLPEISAAATIEFAAHRFRALDPILAPHLLGSDPEYPGPAFLTLFYLARQLQWLVPQPHILDGLQTRRWVVGDPTEDHRGALPVLVEAPNSNYPNDPATAIGRVQLLDPLDAFNDFMRYHGQVPGPGVAAQLRSGSTIELPAWHAAHAQGALAPIQRQIRDLWWGLFGPHQAAKREACFAEMQQLLNDDLTLLPEGDLRDSLETANQAVFRANKRFLEGVTGN